MTDQSPDALDTSGVKRLNKLPMAIVIGIGAFVALSLAYAVNQQAVKQRKKVPTDATPEQSHFIQDSGNSVKELTKNMPEAGDAPRAGTSLTPPPTILSSPASSAVPVLGEQLATTGKATQVQRTPKELAADKAQEEWLAAYRQAAQRKWSVYEAAVASSSRVQIAAPNGGSSSAAGALAGLPSMADLASRRAALETRQNKMMQGAAALAAAPGLPSQVDPNGQDEKSAFAAAEHRTDYLRATVLQPLSPYEVKMGTVIPATMISGIVSDLPGQLIAQVSQDVWDTATGRELLIPQGAKLFGIYDSKISYGQNRILVAWTRITYPDASSLDLGGMSGADQGGYAGFKDKVNNHYVRIFGSALLMSMMSAGVELSMPDRNNAMQSSRSQDAAAEVASEMARVGNAVMQKNINMQPTLTIRPGYRFNVLVSKDIIFPAPYVR